MAYAIIQAIPCIYLILDYVTRPTLFILIKLFEYCPKFVYHGFRYVQVKGDAEIKEIRAHFVHTDFRQIGQFICSEPLLNNLYAMSLNAICSNYHGFPTDCPHREKTVGRAMLNCLWKQVL